MSALFETSAWRGMEPLSDEEREVCQVAVAMVISCMRDRDPVKHPDWDFLRDTVARHELKGGRHLATWELQRAGEGDGDTEDHLARAVWRLCAARARELWSRPGGTGGKGADFRRPVHWA